MVVRSRKASWLDGRGPASLSAAERSAAGSAGSTKAVRDTGAVTLGGGALATVLTLRHWPLFHEPSSSETNASAAGMPRTTRQQGSTTAEPSVHQSVSGLYSASSLRASIALSADITPPVSPVGRCQATFSPRITR